MKRLLLLLMLAALLVASDAPAAPARASAPRACLTEDSPGWNWTRCGNRKRGVIVRVNGSHRRYRVIVGTREFCRADRAFSIDWDRTPALLGDPTCGLR